MSIQPPLPTYPSREEVQTRIVGRFRTNPTDSPLSLQSVTSDGTWVTASGPYPTTPPNTTRETPTASPFPSYASSSYSSSSAATVAKKSVPPPLKVSGESRHASPAPISNPSLVVGLQALANTFTRLGNTLSMAPTHTLSLEEVDTLMQEYEGLSQRITTLTAAMHENVDRSLSELQVAKVAVQAQKKRGGETRKAAPAPTAVLRKTSTSPRQVRRASTQILDSPSSSRSCTPVDEYVSSSDSEYEQAPLPNRPPPSQLPQHKKPWSKDWSPYFPEEGDSQYLRKPLAPRQKVVPLPGYATSIPPVPHHMTSTRFDQGVNYPNLIDVPVNVRPRPRFGRVG